ncbi:hypothetical protein [Selenomonas ruminantium]|uniref:hypothetical protein n=1 Tax=Selenomonas ruminantium TaxID=971 RepID=UPI0026EC0415|nr:hypothetical protein [Selenomonas ruminantium]
MKKTENQLNAAAEHHSNTDCVEKEPFWCEKNQEYLAESIAELEKGKGVEHDLIDD